MYKLALLMLALAGPALEGCSVWHKSEKLDYRTVAESSARDPEGAQKHNKLAMLSLDMEHPVKAELHAQKALIADVSYGPAHLSLGKAFYLQHKYYLAAWEFEHAIGIMPGRPEPFNNLGLVYEATWKYDDAVMNYQIAHSLEANHPEYLGNLVRCRMKKGDRQYDLKLLLEHLVFVETRPDWEHWAREQLALYEFEAPDAETDKAVEESSVPVEELMPVPPLPDFQLSPDDFQYTPVAPNDYPQ